MRSCIILFFVFIFVSSCTTSPITLNTPLTLTGTVSKPSFTGWYRDYCEDGALLEGEPNCAQIGGEIYKVVLQNARTENGNFIKKLVIAFPAHALPNNYKSVHSVYLVKTPEGFRIKTGISYIATWWGNP